MRHVLAVARYAIQTNVLTPFTWAGAVLLVAVALIGPAISLRNHGSWGFDPQLLGTGYAFGALFVIRSGLVEQRIGGVQDFLRVNFIGPLEHMAGAILSLLAAWLLHSAFAFVVALALSLGDVGLAAWTVWLLLLTLAMLLPFTLMVECVSDLRTPLFVPGFIYFAAMLSLSATLGYARTATLLGLNADRSWPASSLPLAARAGIALVGGIALVLAATWLRGRCRAGRLRRARAGT